MEGVRVVARRKGQLRQVEVRLEWLKEQLSLAERLRKHTMKQVDVAAKKVTVLLCVSAN